jgi:SAM-dependent methyltransferase
MVGESGRVFTNELGDERVGALRERVADSGVQHITVVAGDPVKTNFPDGVCDALFMRNVYHHFDDPTAMNASIAAALKPGSRLAIVDFAASSGGEAERAADRDRGSTHGVTAESVSSELQAAGFDPVASESSGRWFMVVVSKPS